MSDRISAPFDNNKKNKRWKPKVNRRPYRIDQAGDVSSQLSMLSEPLLWNIFLRLPAINLVQIKCVCKAWNNIIETPDFAKMHLEVCAKKDNLNFILRHEKLYFVDSNALNKAIMINHPLTCPKGWTDVLGSCNGLICIYNEDEDIAIWNPLTGRCHKIPVTRFERPKGFYHFFVHGFGYDSISDDYKVVRELSVHRFPGHDFDRDFYGVEDENEDEDYAYSEVQVYSLKRKCWRSIDCFPNILCYTCPGVLANGALYWVARRKGETDSELYIIMALDLESEKCREVPQPNYHDTHFHMTLWLWGGSLCILCHYPRHCVDVWVMNDPKLQSWSMLFSVTQPKPIKFFEYVKPLAYSKNGSEVLLEMNYSKFIWYNLKKKSIRYLNIRGLPKSFETEVFVGSLIDPCNISRNSGRNVMKSGFHDVSLATFPNKLLAHILVKLPAKTLCQLKCVCKTWYNTVSDPEFIKAHLRASDIHGSDLPLICGAGRLFCINLQQLDKSIEIDHPLFGSEESTNVVGSSNGLVCLYNGKDIVLWNPLTGDYERLPDANFQLNASKAVGHCFIHGFGYDLSTDDYKVVCILHMHRSLRGGSIRSEVQIYSLRANSWGKVRHFPYVVYPCSGILANGALHWVARENPELFSSSHLLIAFDLEAEKCKVLAQPNYIDTDFHMSLGLLKDSLCVICHYPKQSVDIWILADPRTKMWTRLVSISQRKPIKRFEYLKPLAYSEDGIEVLLEQDNEKLLWYNMIKKTVDYVEVKGLPKTFETVMCSGSLVRLRNTASKYRQIYEDVPEGSQNKKDFEKDYLDGFLAKEFTLKL